jgi:type IV secretion system protein VirB6
MLLFDQTRGLFEGWVRATISFAMAPLAVNVFGAVMLMILAPFLEILVGNSAKTTFDMGPVITVALIIAVFAIVMFFGLGAVAAIGRGFATERKRNDESSPRRFAEPERIAGSGPGERAEQIAARISMMDRESSSGVYSTREVFTRRTGDIADAMATAPMVSGDRLGQSYSRAPRPTMRRGEES